MGAAEETRKWGHYSSQNNLQEAGLQIDGNLNTEQLASKFHTFCMIFKLDFCTKVPVNC